MPALAEHKLDEDGVGSHVLAARLPPALAGSCVAASASVMAAGAFAPRFSTTIAGLILRAAAYILLVFVVAACVAFCAGWIASRNRISATEIGLRTAQAVVWMAPLVAALGRRSWFALLVWALLAAEIARLAVFLTDPDESEVVLQPTHPDGLFHLPAHEYALGLASLLGSFFVQAAILTAVGGHLLLAGWLFLAGSLALIWRGAGMLRDFPRPSADEVKQRTTMLLVFASALIAFIWFPYLLAPGMHLGGARSGRTTWLFHQPSNRVAGNTPQVPIDKSGPGGSPLVPGPVFPGVILYPETRSHVRLIAPTPETIGSGLTQADLSIPFDGVYWFWRPPDDQPPATAVFRYGSPSALTFRSTDGSPIWMEAHQNLATQVKLGCCSAIEVVLENADKQPGTVSIELLVSNTTLPDRPEVTLGTQEAVLPAGIHPGVKVAQTLVFPVPREAKISQFDELTVRYRLKWWRGSRSANIAITRFRLLPLR